MRVVEVTGIAGVGKSYIINQLNQNKEIILDSTVMQQHHLNDIKLGFFFFKSQNSLEMLKIIVQIAMGLKRGIFHKVNFIRNSMKKIGKNYFLIHDKKNQLILVDEGISHLYQNIIACNQNDKESIRLIDRLLLLSNFSNRVVVVDAPQEVIFERLKNRGHKRLEKNDEIWQFIKNSKINLEMIKNHFKGVITIQNETNIDLTSKIKMILSVR